MFSAVALSDRDVAKKITLECGGEYDESNTMHLVFIWENSVSGIASAKFIGGAIRITFVGLVDRVRGKGFGDFLTRSMINKVMDIADTVEIDSVSDYFVKFGFIRQGDIMVCKSKDIIFPSKCRH